MFRALLVIAALAVVASAAPVQDQITSLPNAPQFDFGMYGGYLDVAPTRQLYYLFQESQRSPSTDPVVLWLNGGPGCSSLGGAFTENGAFYAAADGNSLEINPYSWNTVANMIFLEGPAGVGFSKNQDLAAGTGDAQTALDNYNALLAFFEAFPEFAGREFYLTGESYFGHYGPQLAYLILEGNNEGNKTKMINFKGMMAGNPLTNLAIDTQGTQDALYQQAFISPSTYANINKYCIGNWVLNPSSECNYWQNVSAMEQGDIDPYDVYIDVCNAPPVASQMQPNGRPIGRHSPLGQGCSDDMGSYVQDPCISQHLQEYLNYANVQDALHAKPTNWTDCTGIVNYNMTNVAINIVPLYSEVLIGEIDILIYSGSVDTVVPHQGTQVWVGSLGLNVTAAWRPYHYDTQVAGYLTMYDGLSFATVRNAGHEVPLYQPARGLVLFSNFLDGTLSTMV